MSSYSKRAAPMPAHHTACALRTVAVIAVYYVYKHARQRKSAQPVYARHASQEEDVFWWTVGGDRDVLKPGRKVAFAVSKQTKGFVFCTLPDLGGIEAGLRATRHP